PASAAPVGVGTTSATTTVLNVALGNNGSLLNIRLLGDDDRATIDPAVAKPSDAITKLTPLAITSSVIPALNISVPAIESHSTGSPSSVAAPAIGVPAAVPSVLAAGTIQPGTLQAVVDTLGARAGLASTVQNLS